MQSLLNPLFVQRVCHNGRLDVLPGSKIKKLTKAITRADQRTLNANALEGEQGQGNGSRLQSGSKRVDDTIGINKRNEAIIVSCAESNAAAVYVPAVVDI